MRDDLPKDLEWAMSIIMQDGQRPVDFFQACQVIAREMVSVLIEAKLMLQKVESQGHKSSDTPRCVPSPDAASRLCPACSRLLAGMLDTQRPERG